MRTIYYTKCRVCGFEDTQEPPWTKIEGQLYPSYEMCACCGCQFGYDDNYKEDVIFYRKRWIADGAKFFILSLKPEGWNIKNQINCVDEQWL